MEPQRSAFIISSVSPTAPTQCSSPMLWRRVICRRRELQPASGSTTKLPLLFANSSVPTSTRSSLNKCWIRIGFPTSKNPHPQHHGRCNSLGQAEPRALDSQLISPTVLTWCIARMGKSKENQLVGGGGFEPPLTESESVLD